MSLLARLVSYAASLPTLAKGFTVSSLAGAAVAIARRRTGVVALRGGPRFRVRTLLDVWVVKETCLDGVYDVLANDLPEEAVIVDVGAGLGDFAVHAALRSPRARIVAVEPHPGSFRLLEENLAANGVTNVRALPVALTETAAATVPLDVGAREPALFTTTAPRVSRAVDVPNRTLAALLEHCGLERVDLLKLDCEGAEFGILLEASGETLRRIERIVLEWHEGVTQWNAADLAGRLESAGFVVSLRRSAVIPSTGILEARCGA